MLGDDRFVLIHGAINRLNRFLSNAQNHPSLVVELGVGARNGFVKHPIMQWVARTPQAFYVSVNLGELFIPADIDPRSLGINASISQFLAELIKHAFKKGASAPLSRLLFKRNRTPCGRINHFCIL